MLNYQRVCRNMPYAHPITSCHFMSSLRFFLLKYLPRISAVTRSRDVTRCHEVTAWQFQWQCSGGLPWSSSPLRRNSSSAEPWWPYHSLGRWSAGCRHDSSHVVSYAVAALSDWADLFLPPGTLTIWSRRTANTLSMLRDGRVPTENSEDFITSWRWHPLWPYAAPNGEPWTKWRGGSIMGSRPKKCMPSPSMPAATASGTDQIWQG